MSVKPATTIAFDIRKYLFQPIMALLMMIVVGMVNEMRSDIRSLLPRVITSEVRIASLETQVAMPQTRLDGVQRPPVRVLPRTQAMLTSAELPEAHMPKPHTFLSLAFFLD